VEEMTNALDRAVFDPRDPRAESVGHLNPQRLRVGAEHRENRLRDSGRLLGAKRPGAEGRQFNAEERVGIVNPRVRGGTCPKRGHQGCPPSPDARPRAQLRARRASRSRDSDRHLLRLHARIWSACGVEVLTTCWSVSRFCVLPESALRGGMSGSTNRVGRRFQPLKQTTCRWWTRTAPVGTD
jgi:hypothetical protein